MTDQKTWRGYRQPTEEQLELARAILVEVQEGTKVAKAIRHHPLEAGGFVGKNVLVEAYRQLTDSGEWREQPELLRAIRMKPTRTLSGVTTVTVLLIVIFPLFLLASSLVSEANPLVLSPPVL